jgi:hypothetical protein
MSRSQSAVIASLIIAATSLAGARQPSSAVRADPPPPAPVAKAAGAKAAAFSTIIGNALDSTDGQLANVPVRLRDARFGRIVDSQYTDQSGIFTFKSVDPGSYIVELLANNETILAASQLLNVNAGETVSTVVKLPHKQRALARMMGTETTTPVSVLLLEAAATGITALVPTAPISPNQ